MTDKHKIHMDSANMQAQRDAELRATGSVPEEVMSESPDEADMVAESSAETVLPQDIQALAERCRVAELKAEDEHDQLLRTLADFNNYRRRAREEMDQSRKFAIEDFTIRLLPILDNFERAIKASEELHDFDALHGGEVLILRNLNDVLEKEGVKPIEAEGQQFDPNIHEAVMRMETDDYPDNTIVEELQKGYTLGDKVIRASMVKVSCKP